MDTTRTDSRFRLDVLTTLNELEAVRPQWSALWARCDRATPFQMPEWLITWYELFGGKIGRLHVLIIYSDDRCVGLAPFMVQPDEFGENQMLVLLGDGFTGYQDILAEPACEHRVCAAIAEYLDEHADAWNCCDFQQLRSGSSLLTLETGPQFASEIMVQEVCPVLALPEASEELRRGPSGRMIQKLAHYRRSGARDHKLIIERADNESFEELFDAFVRLQRSRLSGRLRQAETAFETVENFYRRSAMHLLKLGVLRLYGLRLDGRIVASLYALAGGGRTFHYVSASDPAWSSLSPGSLLIGHAIEQAVHEHCTEFDFLGGREAYKYLWGARGQLNCRRRLWPVRELKQRDAEFPVEAEPAAAPAG
jgi:CelD/BcsL family acetyltransferase involved in cellulose biosynthesis